MEHSLAHRVSSTAAASAMMIVAGSGIVYTIVAYNCSNNAVG